MSVVIAAVAVTVVVVVAAAIAALVAIFAIVAAADDVISSVWLSFQEVVNSEVIATAAMTIATAIATVNICCHCCNGEATNTDSYRVRFLWPSAFVVVCCCLVGCFHSI